MNDFTYHVLKNLFRTETYYKKQYNAIFIEGNFLKNSIMAKILRYINGNNQYSLTEGGEPDRQTLNMGGTVQVAYISHSLSVAENSGTQYKKLKGENHSYYATNDGVYGVETENGSETTCYSEYLPKYLNGWQTINAQPYNYYGVVDSTYINTYFNNGEETNLNLYGVWGDTKFLRVIVSAFSSSQTINPGIFFVNVTDEASYDSTNIFSLPPNFKETIDYSNREKHLTLKFGGTESTAYTELGTGHGCPKIVGEIRYPTYFGFKSGNALHVELTVSNSSYIPYYENVNNMTVYKAYICQEGLSRDFTDKVTESLMLSKSQENVWKVDIPSPDSDKTLFFKLMMKPVVNVTVLPVEGGVVSGGNRLFMPGDTCTLVPVPNSDYALDSVVINNQGELSEPYSFTVLNPVTNVTVYFTKK